MNERTNRSFKSRPGSSLVTALVLVMVAFFGFLLTANEVSAASPMVTIESPTDSMIIYGDTYDLDLTITDFNLSSDFGGTNVAGEGHWHLYINGNMQGMYATEDITLTSLPVGNHIFEVELVENDHTSLSPKVNATVNVSVVHPSIHLMDPPDNSILYGGMMHLKAGVENFTLTSDYGSSNVNGEGHWHVYINDVLQGPYSGPWANFTGLSAGNHEVKIDLRNNDHTTISPISEEIIDITVVETMPEVMVKNLPMNAVGYGGKLNMNLGLMNFSLSNNFGGANVPGEGHWHLYINDVMQGMYSSEWLNLTDLPAGDHVFRVEIVNNDHSPIIPPVQYEFNVKIRAEQPEIMIMHPMDGHIQYDGDLDVEVMVNNFTMNASAIGQDPVAGEGHYHIYINDGLVGPYTDMMTTLEDLPAGDHEIKVELVNNDHSSLVPAIMDSANFTISDLEPMIMLKSPMDGQINYNDDLDVEVMVYNFTMNASAIGMDNMPGEGHYHIYINDVLIGPYTDMMVYLEDLPAGDHLMKVELVNNDHTPLVPPVHDMAEFTIVNSVPMIEIVSPMDDSILYKDHLDLEVSVTGLEMNASAIGGENMVGEGHYHIYINDALIGPYTDTMVMLDDLPPGDHLLKVQLVNNDHTPVIPEITDMIEFTVVGDLPDIMIESPMNGSIIYDDMFYLEVNVTDFMLNGTFIGLSNVPGMGHYHIYINDDLVGPYADQMVELTDLPVGDHVLKVELRNNDHSPLMGDMEMFMDIIHFTISDIRPAIHITHPMNGSIIYSNMTDLHVDVMNFTLNGSAIGGMKMEGEGHYHIYINDVLVGPYNETMVHLKDLPAGDHVLKVVLVNNDHSYIHPMTMDMIHFTLLDGRPSISIVKPVDGAFFYGSTLDVEVSITDLMMNASAIGGNKTPGEGHYHIYINGDLVGPYTDTMVFLTDLPVGRHQMKVMLVNNDHSPLMPEASAMVEFHLLAIPSIEIVSPSNGTTLDTNTLDLEVEITNLVMNASAIGGSNTPGEGHYHIYINGDLVGPYTDMMVSLPDLPAGDHILTVELRNNDHSALGVTAMDMLYFTIEEPEPADTNITVSFGPVLYDGEPLEGAMVMLMYGEETLSGTTGSDGMVMFTVPMEWKGMTIDYKVTKEDYKDLEGSGTLSDDGVITVSGDLELDEEKEDDGSDMTVWIIVIVLIVVVLIAIFIIMRPKDTTTDLEE